MKLLKRYRIQALILSLASSPLIRAKTRRRLYNIFGIDLDVDQIFPKCTLKSSQFFIGANSFINEGCIIFNEVASVTIGSNCRIGPEVMMCTTTHEIGHPELRAGTLHGKEINIEDGCWIGARATILAGVTIKKGCVVGAGAIVNKNCEPNGMYVGVPARRIKDLDD